MKLISRTLNLTTSPISAAHDLLLKYVGERPVLDLSQGAPNYPTARVIANHVAHTALEPDGGMYTTRPGLDKLRELVAQDTSKYYEGGISSNQVLITAGCNQAFCLAISSIAESGDEVILPVPYFFNHDMWLKLERIKPVYLDTSPSFIPDPEVAERLITEKTKAIVLVTPGNPTGAIIPPSVIESFSNLSKKYNIMLVVDETYKVFRPTGHPPHFLFRDFGWDENVISLQSYSKEFAIPGYRVGAVICNSLLLIEMMKLFDCMAICAPRLGQEAVHVALTSAKTWRDEMVIQMLSKQKYFEKIFEKQPGGFELKSSGAFYGWVKHPVNNMPANEVVTKLLINQGILVLPGTLFTPNDEGYLRFSFAGMNRDDFADLGLRLEEFRA